MCAVPNMAVFSNYYYYYYVLNMTTGLGLTGESLQSSTTGHLSDISHLNLLKQSGYYVHTTVANPYPAVRSCGRVRNAFLLSPPSTSNHQA